MIFVRSFHGAAESFNKHFVCEVCGESSANPAMAGLELNRDAVSAIRLCRQCGPVALDLMQICREVTIGCADH